MLTRCPACQTAFRLSAEQLAARGGKVRCGHCFHPFNAHEHALGAKPPEPAAPEREASATPAAELFILEEKPAPLPAALEMPQAAPAFSSVDKGPDFSLPETLAAEPAKLPEVVRSGRRATAAASSASSVALSTQAAPPLLDDFGEDKLAFAYDPERALRTDGRAPATASDFATQLAARFATEVGDADLGADEKRGESLPVEDRGHTLARTVEDSRADSELPAADDGQDAPQAAHVNLHELDARYGRPPARPRRSTQWLLGTGIVLLGLALAGQLLYLYRGELARQLPGLRPLLELACQPLGCEVPLARVASALALESSDLESEPGKPGHFRLHFSLSNRADHEQAWPHVELTLTDARDMPVARRVLNPAEWLPAKENAAAFASRRSLSALIRFQTEELAPTGYRVYLFYP